jgi:hypothetical protein
METGMDTKQFERALTGAEQLLERIHNRVGVGTDDEEWIRKRAHEGIERARAELARTRDDIWWRDEDLPF